MFTQRTKATLARLAAGLSLLGMALAWAMYEAHWPWQGVATTSVPPGPDSAHQALAARDADLARQLQSLLAQYRKIIVLLAHDESLSASERQQAHAVGQAIFHDKLQQEARLEQQLATLAQASDAAGLQALSGVLDYVESAPGLYDADRLAYREVLLSLQKTVGQDGSLPAIKLHKRIGEDLDALSEIERTYEREISSIFSSLDTRAMLLKREKWDDYLAHVNGLYKRDQILKDYGYIAPYPASDLPREDNKTEVFGYQLPRKTIALTFDDGPHAAYTEEIVAILKQYGVPGTFFEVGRNLGSVDAQGHVVLGKNAAISRKLMEDGYAVGNHSYTHALLSKETGDALKAEINNTDVLLRAIDAKRAPIFRFPYGARTDEGKQLLETAHLRSIMWNIDSLDWADPVPKSIVDRVLRDVEKEQRGIILFHDIHDRAVKALPTILDRLVADGYQFARWDGSDFSVQSPAQAYVARRQSVAPAYGNSWAVVIGINQYAKWPRLQYAVNDAQSVRQILIDRFGFSPEHVILLKDAEATRNHILSAFHEQLGNGQVQKDDRVFVFFSGHGATRQLSSGRDVGYLIPVDADPKDTATDAIPMTEIQNIAESLEARQVFFVMDACYSGLGLTRGGSGFLNDNAKRIGRQMLTAGGADQEVADGGPQGHSIFTWTLLQGLDGKADLNGDGVITATELAAYVAPAVARVSLQTPAFGSLPGSQGGDFVFELPVQNEFLSADSNQLSGDAIALNARLDTAHAAVSAASSALQSAAVAPVQVVDLQGQQQSLKPTLALKLSARQLAQRANDRGLLQYREKRYAQAEAEFTQALKLRPEFALAANNLGFVYYKQDKFSEAARWFENAIKWDPSRAVAYLNLGDAYAQAGNGALARKAYGTYLELQPKGPGAMHARTQMTTL